VAAKFTIGVDLGTTNCALAYAPISEEPAQVQPMLIPQLVNPGEVREESLLAVVLYVPGASEFPAGTLALPWDESRATSRNPGT